LFRKTKRPNGRAVLPRRQPVVPRHLTESVSILTAVCALALAATAQTNLEMAAGRFRPSWDSLKPYRCPDWFRAAGFGIWAHWSAQCVPEQDDGYAHGAEGLRVLDKADKLAWTRTADALVVELPSQKPCDYAHVLKIR
jgi:hypothetical protein